MEAWYSTVRNLKDESEDAKLTRDFCFDVYHDLMYIKQNRTLKEKDKFRNRMGVEFDTWTNELLDSYSQEMITEVLSDDAFWNATLAVTFG
jgi:hypothetical protein